MPSRTISESTAETQSLIGSLDRERLITKWRKQVSEDDERVAFDIDTYQLGRNMPTDHYLLEPQDARLTPDVKDA
jgi:hypothetical protein